MATLAVYGGLFFALSLIQPDLGLNTLFDLSFTGYSYETAQEIVQSLSDESRTIYFGMIFPLDFFFPLFYCLLAYRGLLTLWTSSRSKNLAPLLPTLLFVVDLSENFLVRSILLGTVTESKVLLASSLTQLKWILILLLVVWLVVLGVDYWLHRRKASQ